MEHGPRKTSVVFLVYHKDLCNPRNYPENPEKTVYVCNVCLRTRCIAFYGRSFQCSS